MADCRDRHAHWREQTARNRHRPPRACARLAAESSGSCDLSAYDKQPNSRRGHYFYRLRPGERFGCGLGKLKPPHGAKWGEVKCYGGAVVLGPTQHPRAAEGGHYSTGPAGSIPLVPDEIADKLNAVSDPGECRATKHPAN